MMKVSLILFLASTAYHVDKATAAMSEVVWVKNLATSYYEATIEFCEDAPGSYGYRLPGTTTCDPAGVVIRMVPDQNYIMTLKNTASVVTNAHTHGLHISGDGNADDVTREVHPGNCLKYYWEIPLRHMGGTFWLHAHVHELTAEQVDGGAYSMVIIEDDPSPVPVYDEGVQQWLSRENERLLVASKQGNTRLGNGKPFPDALNTIGMLAGEWYRLRVAAVDAGGKNSDLEFSGDCEIHAVAHDGVWRFKVPKGMLGESESTFSMTGESRLDLAINCPQTADGSFISWANSEVATLNVSDTGTPTSASPFIDGLPWDSFRPPYLEDLRIPVFDNMSPTYPISMSAAKINNEGWDPINPIQTFNFNSDHKWTISGSNAHPFHMHVYHMQTIGCPGHEDGEYYDTISSSGDCEVRFRMVDFGQRIIMHCHVLAHEDKGAMVWVNVTNNDVPIQSTEDSEELDCSGGPAPTTPPPTTPPPTPGCISEGERCISDSDCCSGSCSGGKPSTRVCETARRLRG